MTEVLTVTVNPLRVAVDPGVASEVALHLRNNSGVVDEYSVEVLGDAAAWITLDRARVPTYPSTTEIVRASIHPPRESWPRAGTMPVGFRIRSTNDPSVTAIEECQVDIKPFIEIDGEIKPTTARGRFSASHRLRVINRGNAPASVSIRAKVQQGDCDVSVATTPIMVAAGTRATTKVKVRPSSRFLRGPEEMHSYRLSLTPEGGAPVALDAMMRQRPIARLPTAVLVALALLLGGAYVAYGKGPNPLQQMLAPRSPVSQVLSSPTSAGAKQPNSTSVSVPTTQPTVLPTSLPSQFASGPPCVVGPPTNVSTAAGNAQVTVNWVAPAPPCAVTGYTIVGSPGNIMVPAAARAVSVVVTNLTNCTPYSFVVAAMGSNGAGPGSPPTNPVTPVGPPGPPIGVTSTAGDGNVSLSWGAPSINCAPITNYVVMVSPFAGSVSVGVGSNGGSATVMNLVNDTTYTFTVAAVNSVGIGPTASATAATPRCIAINTLLLSVNTTLYWSARGDCSPYSGTIVETFTSIFGVVTQKTRTFTAAGTNPSGSYYWYGDPPFATSHTSMVMTLTDSKGNSVNSRIVYN